MFTLGCRVVTGIMKMRVKMVY